MKMVDDGQMTTEPWLYYKLTYEPKGSGELTSKHMCEKLSYQGAFQRTTKFRTFLVQGKKVCPVPMLHIKPGWQYDMVRDMGIAIHNTVRTFYKLLYPILKGIHNGNTVMILSFRTDRSGQTVQTQIKLLLEEQSDQGLHCLPFRLHLLDSLLYGRAT